jgi:hypothetical protein
VTFVELVRPLRLKDAHRKNKSKDRDIDALTSANPLPEAKPGDGGEYYTRARQIFRVCKF